MKQKVFWLIYLLWLGIWLVACQASPPSAEPTPGGQVTPLPTFTAAATVTPSSTPIIIPPTPTIAPTIAPTPVSDSLREHVMLPATLYFLSIDGQIWLVENETYVHEQLTHEALPIIDFDVAQAHGRLIYVTNNQLIEFDPVTQQRSVKLPSLTEADLWTITDNGASVCSKCPTDQILAPRYSPDGTQIAYAQNGINLIAAGVATAAASQRLQANVDLTPEMQNVDATRFYYDSQWSPDGTRIAFHAGAWEWHGYEIYDLAQGSLQMVRSLTVPAVHLCCLWQWGDNQTAYVTAPMSHGPIPDTGLYRVDAATGAVTQLNTGTPSDMPLLARGTHSAYQTAAGELYALIAVNDEDWPWQPMLYTLYRIDPTGGAPTPFNPSQLPIEGEVLWAPNGSGVIAMTANFALPSKPAKGKFVWLSTNEQNGASQPLNLRGSHLRWGPTRID